MKKVLGILLLFSVIACKQAKGDKGELSFEANPKPTPVNETTPEEDDSIDIIQKVSFDELKNKILKPKNCLNCHGGMKSEKGLSFFIEPGQPEDSSLYVAVKDGRMPIGGRVLTTAELEIVENYILGL